MTEELRIGPERPRPRTSTVLAVVAAVTAVMVVAGAWLIAPRDPVLTLDQIRSSYGQPGRVGGAMVHWDLDRLSVRDWAMSQRDVSGDCSRLTNGSDLFDSSPFAVVLRGATLSRDDGRAVFSGDVGTFGYPDTEAATVALTDFGELLHRCVGSVGLFRECLVQQVVVRPHGPDARSRFTVTCSAYSHTTVTDVVQVGNSLTVIEPGYGVDQDVVDETVDQIRRSLRDV